MATEQPGYIAPDVGVDALKDAIAAVRCVAVWDAQGLDAVLSGTARPQAVAAMLATLAVIICRKGGLDDPGIDALLASIKADATNFLLDQPQPEGVTSHDQRL